MQQANQHYTETEWKITMLRSIDLRGSLLSEESMQSLTDSKQTSSFPETAVPEF